MQFKYIAATIASSMALSSAAALPAPMAVTPENAPESALQARDFEIGALQARDIESSALQARADQAAQHCWPYCGGYNSYNGYVAGAAYAGVGVNVPGIVNLGVGAGSYYGAAVGGYGAVGNYGRVWRA